MSPNTRAWDELHLAVNPAVELLDFLGYTYVPPEALEGERKSFKETILTLRLAKILKQLNPWLSETNVAKAVKTVTHVAAASLAEANEKVYTSLTYGIALEQDRGDGRKSHTVRFFDFDRPDRNEWIVTRQYKVLGSKKHIVPDVVVFVNGLPLAVIECKSPTIGDAWKAKAIQQLHRYQEAGTQWKDQGAPRLFEVAQILVGTCGERAVYGTVGAPERFFLRWKEPYPLSVKQLGERLGRKPTPQDVLLYGLLEPRNLLDIVRNFVVFEVEGGRSVRKLVRYKQFIAVNEAMGRIRTARKPSERGGIVWHTQGSGKSLTMLWLALKLRRDAAQQQPYHCDRHRPHQARSADCGRVHCVRFPESRAGIQCARAAANPGTSDRQDGDDHDPEVPGDHRHRPAGGGPPDTVRGHQHLRHGGRSPPHAVQEPGGEHAAGAAQCVLSRLHRHANR